MNSDRFLAFGCVDYFEQNASQFGGSKICIAFRAEAGLAEFENSDVPAAVDCPTFAAHV